VARKKPKTPRKPKRKPKAAGYLELSRRLPASYVFVAPLFAVYQLGLALDADIRNGTAPLLREFVDRFSNLGLVFLNLVLLGTLLLAIWHTRRRRGEQRGFYGWMVLESCAWTVVMLLVAWFVVPGLLAHLERLEKLLSLPPMTRRVLAFIGAGIYEEVLFRFFLMGGLLMVLQRGLGGHPAFAVPVATLASAAVFSWAHHAIGGQPFTWPVFWYRAVMGTVLGAIFYARGLGIVVYVHALYNVALIALHHGP